MTRHALPFLAVLAVAGNVRADDTATIQQLKDFGAQVQLDKSGGAAEVSFKDSSKLGPDQFRLIGGLNGLKSLTLYGSCKGLNDETLPLLGKLTALETLHTDGALISDGGFRQFAAFKALKQLALFHVSYQLKGFTGAGFKHLKAVPNLRGLTYAGTLCGDEALAALTSVTQLRDLQTWHTWAGPDAAEQLASMTHLTTLKYGQSLGRYDGKPKRFALTDETLPAVAKLADLETLSLEEARLSLDALLKLKGLSKLRKLSLVKIDISPADVEKLRGELKGVEITYAKMTEAEQKQLEAMLAQPNSKEPAKPSPATQPVAWEVEVAKDLTYYDGADKDKDGFHTLDVYSPKGAKNAPVLLFVHGGGWSRKDGDGYAKGRGGPHTFGFASRGVIVVTISYRLSPEHKHPAHVEDVARAIAWTKANAAKYGGDPKQLFLTGHSAGGHLVALVVANPKYLAVHQLAAADVRGVIPISAPFTVGVKGNGAAIWGDEAAAKDASPTTHLREGLPPFFVLAGDTSGVEKWLAAQSEEFVRSLNSKKVSAKFMAMKDRDHSTIVTKLGTADDRAAELILQFMRDARP